MCVWHSSVVAVAMLARLLGRAGSYSLRRAERKRSTPRCADSLKPIPDPLDEDREQIVEDTEDALRRAPDPVDGDGSPNQEKTSSVVFPFRDESSVSLRGTPDASGPRDTTPEESAGAAKMPGRLDTRTLVLELVKGGAGLGFSVTTRDNPAGRPSPVYVKNVLRSGAAFEDGRLRPGDRLLEVDGVAMTGKSQDEAVAILRNVPHGATARLLVSRQDEHAGSFRWQRRERPTYRIPLGGGVKRSDPGVFVKAAVRGGAAEGRLRVGDPLVDANGVSLLGEADAVDALRVEAADRGSVRVPDERPTPSDGGMPPEEPEAGFARGAFGRQSMSEKRHAQLDARNTHTYQRKNKKARETPLR